MWVPGLDQEDGSGAGAPRAVNGLDGPVAGHEFLYRPGTGYVCGCGRRWLDIRNTTMADVRLAGIAHKGRLEAYEVASIERAREREDALIAAAMAGDRD